jgi:hypothetical protein
MRGPPKPGDPERFRMLLARVRSDSDSAPWRYAALVSLGVMGERLEPVLRALSALGYDDALPPWLAKQAHEVYLISYHNANRVDGGREGRSTYPRFSSEMTQATP